MAAPLPTPYPHAHYYRCLDNSNPPPGYVGDWPEQGKVYAGHVKTSFYSGQPHVYLDGFWAEAPWGCFALDRFEHFLCLHLN